jgi:putative two-component system response regulator
MLATKIAQTHHERWDGTGYPFGLAGEDIPIEGRMTAVADVYDVLSSRRAYKPPFSRKKCCEILEKGRGTQFDPKVLDTFFARKDEIIEVQIQYMDVD